MWPIDDLVFDKIRSEALATPAQFNDAKSKVDWMGVREIMNELQFDPQTWTWCQLGHMPINALVDGPQLVLVGHKGILATLGKKKLLGGGRKFDSIVFQKVQSFSVADLQDDTHGGGKFGIEFFGPGGMMLGRLAWAWRGARFRNNQEEIMAVAEERDRVLGYLGDLVN